MTDSELQDEEREVLLSIYEGDSCFKQISPNVFQYKVNNNLKHLISVLFKMIIFSMVKTTILNHFYWK